MKKNVYYFNINYLCDNKCIFCYSHNTNNLKTESIITLKEIIKTINKYKISEKDRLILNGGEPLLHKEINEILNYISNTNIETLIFTNGRNLTKLNPNFLTKNIRFIIPIHGDENTHNYITKDTKSFQETLSSFKWLYENNLPCLVDLKIILNNETIKKLKFEKALKIWKEIPINNAIHITKMMDTKVSKTNGCQSLNLDVVNKYTLKLFNDFKNNRKKLKFYSTCIKDILSSTKYEIEHENLEITLLYKDYASEHYIDLNKKNTSCIFECDKKEYCLSEVDTYNVLEFYNNKFYNGME